MERDKLILPVSIVLSSILLGGIFYTVQIKKQESIEFQQKLKIVEDRGIRLEKADKDEREANFTNNLKCQALLKDLRNRWNNVVGIYYDTTQNTCIVKYTKNGKVEESDVEYMQGN